MLIVSTENEVNLWKRIVEMELVYLWVEEYKNIYKQGFNFSPRFDCEYIQGELKVTDKKETKEPYLENFFGEDINITAIVGKNGSGKSNILKALFQNADHRNFDEKLWYILYDDDKKKLNIYFINDMKISKKKDISIKDTYCIEELKKDAELLNKDSSLSKVELDFSMIYFSNMLQYLPIFNDEQNKSFSNISISYLINKYSKEMKSDNFIEFKYQYNYYKSKIIEQTIIMLRDTNLKLDFALPKELNIVINTTYYSDKLENVKQLITDEADSFRLSAKLRIIYNYFTNSLNSNELKEQIGENKPKLIEELYNEIKIKVFLDDELDKFLVKLEDSKSNHTSIKISEINKDFLEKLKAFNSTTECNNGISDIFHLNWRPELSSGQENYLFQFASFYNILKKGSNLKKDIIILIDEGETTMHPNWQKRYLKYYIDFFTENFKNENKNIHIILTSHSPFILSDLPKENVIFLDKYKKDENQKEGNCKNVTKDMTMKPFGANIHTLLSDGFFMDGGLMGEFAKGKIQEILNFLDKEKNEKLKTIEKSQILPIIDSIGEDFLREKLLSMYFEKFPDEKQLDDKDIKIRELEKELAELRK